MGPKRKGERELAQLWNVVERAENQVLSGFSERERAQCTDFLQGVINDYR
jgi:DNA-binding MarR family transcriptional regulator